MTEIQRNTKNKSAKTKSNKYSIDELKLISEILGIDLYKAMLSEFKEDKTLPKKFYRNGLTIQYEDKRFDNLVKCGFAEVYKRNKMDFIVSMNVLGIAKYRYEFSDFIVFVPIQNRNLSYIRKRINDYCLFHYYNYGTESADHVFSSFVNYYLKNYQVSHTTKDCINIFKKELMRFKDQLIECYGE